MKRFQPSTHLWKAASITLDVDLFYAETENFINTLEVWIKLVKDYRDVVPKAEDVKTVMPEIGSNGFIRA